MKRSGFFISEGSKVFKRAGLAGWLAILAFAVFTGLISLAIISQDLLEQSKNQLLTMFEMEVFLEPGQEGQLNSVSETIKTRHYVTDIELISPEKAAKRFSAEFGDELFVLLEENPLPASIIVRYDSEAITPELFETEAEEIGKLQYVDDIAYEGQLLTRLEDLTSLIVSRLRLIIAIVGIISLFLTIVTVRVSIRNSRSWVRAVSQLGGSASDIRTPFVLSGVYMGLFGGLLGSMLIVILQYFLAVSNQLAPIPELLPHAVVVGITTILSMIIASFTAPGVIARLRSA
ncbi:permease-like cell division protein FtsX [bacterium]|nr:permease-like cell division protein FtsX [bacterium]